MVEVAEELPLSLLQDPAREAEVREARRLLRLLIRARTGAAHVEERTEEYHYGNRWCWRLRAYRTRW